MSYQPPQRTGVTYATRQTTAANAGEANLNAINNESKAGCAGFIGAILTLTGIGAIIGIPLMIWAAYLHFTKHKNIGQKEVWVANCPHCDKAIYVNLGIAAVNCPLCSRMIIIEPQGYKALFRAG